MLLLFVDFLGKKLGMRQITSCKLQKATIHWSTDHVLEFCWLVGLSLLKFCLTNSGHQKVVAGRLFFASGTCWPGIWWTSCRCAAGIMLWAVAGRVCCKIGNSMSPATWSIGEIDYIWLWYFFKWRKKHHVVTSWKVKSDQLYNWNSLLHLFSPGCLVVNNLRLAAEVDLLSRDVQSLHEPWHNEAMAEECDEKHHRVIW